MRWIKRLTIKNFQSHKLTIIDFHKGINVIQGETNEGKSSIIRAIRSLFYNDPKGTHLIQHDAEGYIVEVLLDNDIIITKERKEKSNKYFVTFPNGHVEKFEAFGNDVPKFIVKLLESPTFNVDNTKDGEIVLNISSQLEPHFLITSSGTIKSKVLTKLTGGHILDEAIKKNNYDILQNNKEKESLEKELSIVKEDLNKLNQLENSLEKVDSLLSTINKYKALKNKFQQIQKYIENYMNNKNELNHIKMHLSALEENGVHALLIQTVNYKEQHVNINTKKEINRTYVTISNNLLMYNQHLTKLSSVEDIAVKIKGYYEKNVSFNSLTKIKSNIEQNDKTLIQQKESISDLNQMLVIFNKADIILKNQSGFKNSLELNNNLLHIKNRVVKGDNYLNKLNNVSQLNLLLNKYFPIYQKVQSLLQFNKQSYFINQNKYNLINQIQSLSSLSALNNNIHNCIHSIQKNEQLNHHMIVVQKNQNDITNMTNEMHMIEQELDILNNSFNSFESCPLCGQHMGGN